MPLVGEEKRRYQREWFAKRRAEGIEYLGGKCVNCYSTENLQMDHKNPDEKIHHRIWSWSRDKRFAELDKCQLLCPSCHSEKTRRNGERGKHGLTDERYQEVVNLLAEGKLSQAAIGKQLGIGQSTVSRINTGERPR